MQIKPKLLLLDLLKNAAISPVSIYPRIKERLERIGNDCDEMAAKFLGLHHIDLARIYHIAHANTVFL
jgi:hypothetical protein